jgi:hypothetical protein
VKVGFRETTADPSTTLLWSSGRDDKEKVVAYREAAIRMCGFQAESSLVFRRFVAGTEPQSYSLRSACIGSTAAAR